MQAFRTARRNKNADAHRRTARKKRPTGNVERLAGLLLRFVVGLVGSESVLKRRNAEFGRKNRVGVAPSSTTESSRSALRANWASTSPGVRLLRLFLFRFQEFALSLWRRRPPILRRFPTRRKNPSRRRTATASRARAEPTPTSDRTNRRGL